MWFLYIKFENSTPSTAQQFWFGGCKCPIAHTLATLLRYLNSMKIICHCLSLPDYLFKFALFTVFNQWLCDYFYISVVQPFLAFAKCDNKSGGSRVFFATFVAIKRIWLNTPSLHLKLEYSTCIQILVMFVSKRARKEANFLLHFLSHFFLKLFQNNCLIF